MGERNWQSMSRVAQCFGGIILGEGKYNLTWKSAHREVTASAQCTMPERFITPTAPNTPEETSLGVTC